MQPQTLPSSLSVRPVFMASSHTTKTLAMPSNSTLHYAAKQLDDTVINKRTQPFTQQLNTSPPARKYVVQVLATGAQDPPTITAPQQLQRTNTCRSTRTKLLPDYQVRTRHQSHTTMNLLCSIPLKGYNANSRGTTSNAQLTPSVIARVHNKQRWRCQRNKPACSLQNCNS